MTTVLEGIRVLDFGRYLAGPFCAALLGDMGAEVIRIERVEGGEDRTLGPVTDDDMGAVFLQANRNKRGMTLNPSSDQGREITRRLVAGSDVVVANLPPKALLALGLDYPSLCQVKPDIILTTVNAFGSGTWEDKLGFDGLAQAMAGNLHLSGAGGVPTRAFTPYVDYSTASLCALSTVGAIMHRDRTGEGQLIEGALLKTALTLHERGHHGATASRDRPRGYPQPASLDWTGRCIRNQGRLGHLHRYRPISVQALVRAGRRRITARRHTFCRRSCTRRERRDFVSADE